MPFLKNYTHSLSLIFLLVLVNCDTLQPKVEPVPSKNCANSDKKCTPFKQISGKVTFRAGDSSSQNKKLEIGDSIVDGTRLQTGQNSSLDFQFTHSQAEIAAGMKANSQVELRQIFCQRDKIIFFVSKGKLVLKVKSIEPNQSILVLTTETLVTLKPNSTIIVEKKDDSTSLNNTEGEISYRISLPTELEYLSESMVETTQLQEIIKKHFETSEQGLSKGDEVSITRDQLLEHFKSTKLDSLFSNKNVNTLTKSNLTCDEIQQAKTTIQEWIKKNPN